MSPLNQRILRYCSVNSANNKITQKYSFMITKDSLGIFWRFEEGYEEVDGLYFYGNWLHQLPVKIVLKELDQIWKKETIEYTTVI